MLRTLDEFVAFPFPPVEYLLGRWLPKRGLVLLAGYRGVGKTYATLGIAGAIASGTRLLGWEAGEASRVLYVDGEMDPAELQGRLRALRTGLGSAGGLAGRNLSILSHADFEFGIPNLADAEKGGRSLVEEAAEGVALIILDNKSTLCSTGDENSSSEWQAMQDWLIHLRRRGHAVLLIHHGTKPDRDSGRSHQRGTSKIEDPMNTCVMLQRPPGMGRDRFVWEWAKTRGWVPTDEEERFTVEIHAQGGTFHLELGEAGEEAAGPEAQEAEELACLKWEQGYSLREIQADTGLGKDKLGRLFKKKGVEKGQLGGEVRF